MMLLSINIWGQMAKLMIFHNLPWQLKQHLLSQFLAVIVVLLKLDKLDQIPFSLISISVRHVHIIIVQLVHQFPSVLSHPDPYYDYTQRKGSAPDQQIFDLVYVIIQQPVCHYHQNHVFLLLSLHLLTLSHRYFKKRN